MKGPDVMRFFFSHTPFFALIPSLVVADACGCEDPNCASQGFHIALVWAGFAVGIQFSRS